MKHGFPLKLVEALVSDNPSSSGVLIQRVVRELDLIDIFEEMGHGDHGRKVRR